MFARRMYLIASLVTLAACACSTAPATPAGAVRLPITDQYRGWWAELETCSQLTGSIDAVAFYRVDSLPDQTVARRDQDAKGIRIYLVSLFEHTPSVVKHEMLHALLKTGGHPRNYFQGACGDLMNGPGGAPLN